jgi:DNA-binding IclR family transcriptional regulator
VIQFNVPRLIERGFLDEAGLRGALAKVREQGWASLSTGLVPGMAGLGVPIFDAAGQVVAALSIGTLAERLSADRIPFVAQILQREAAGLGARLNPFDVSRRYPSRGLSIFGSVKS